MLLITRRDREEILIGNDVRIVVTRTTTGACQLGIEAPKNVLILRGELLRYDPQTDSDDETSPE